VAPAGCPTVRIGFLPAARATDKLVCPIAPDMIAAGSPTVRIGGLPAARMGDPTGHGGMISMGCPTVRIGVMPQAGTLLAAAETGAAICEDCAADAAAGANKGAPR
jgi:uncharacterized Zn-binding protein involved in type VI secretion